MVCVPLDPPLALSSHWFDLLSPPVSVLGSLAPDQDGNRGQGGSRAPTCEHRVGVRPALDLFLFPVSPQPGRAVSEAGAERSCPHTRVRARQPAGSGPGPGGHVAAPPTQRGGGARAPGPAPSSSPLPSTDTSGLLGPGM